MLKQKSTGYTFTTTDYCITEQIDGKDTLTITIIGGSEDSSHIQAEDIIIESNYTDGTEFVVKKVNGDDESIEVTAELNLDDFKSEIYQDYNKTGRPYAILNDVVPDGWVVDDQSGLTNSSTIELDAPTAADVADSVVNVFGVAIRYNFSNHHQIIYNPKAVKNSGQYLTKELNLTGITRYQDSTNLYNRLYAYGKDNLSFANINYDKPYVENTTYLSDRIRAAYVKDERFTDAQSLLEYATEQLNSMCVPTTSYECIPADIGATDTKYAFLQLKLLDVVTLLDVDTNVRVDHQVVSRVIYPYAPENNSLTLSMTMPSFSKQVISLEDQIKQETSQVLGQIEGVVNELTNQIITASGGHVVINYGDDGKMAEILIMDADDKATATNVIRMNQAGIAFSTSGYNGPFNGILGLDGTWFASFINTWKLNAGTIVSGILQSQDGETFYLDLEKGILKMKATSLSIGASSVATQQYANQQAGTAQQNAQNYAQQQANAAYQAAQQYAQQQAQAAQQAATEAARQELEDYADTVTETVSNLQSQIDGQIMTWFESYDPTTSNYPANQWTDNATKQQHAGDLFYNTSNGDAYRWAQYHGAWQWLEIVDTDVAAALAAAAAAQDTADSKRRVFTAQPVPPYDVGDLWAEENNGPLQVCITAKASGAAFAAADWGDAANYAEQFVGAGRNLIYNSAFAYRWTDKTFAYFEGDHFTYHPNRSGLYYNPSIRLQPDYDLQQLRGQDVTLSVEYNIEEAITNDGSHADSSSFFGVRVVVDFTDGTHQYIPSSMLETFSNRDVTDGWRQITATGTVRDKEVSGCYVVCANQYILGKVSYRRPKLELGTAATSWTTNPYDNDVYSTYVEPYSRNYLLNSQFVGLTAQGNYGYFRDGVYVAECDGNTGHSGDSGVILSVSESGLAELNAALENGSTIDVSVEVKVDETWTYTGTGTDWVSVYFTPRYDNGTYYGIYVPTAPPGESSGNTLGLNVTDGWRRVRGSLSKVDGRKLTDIQLRVYVGSGHTTGKLQVRRPMVSIHPNTSAFPLPPYSQAPEDLETAAKGELMTQEQVFNKLTDNGRLQGLYMQDGNVYFNASYIRSGTMSANYISGGTIDASKVNVTNLNADNIKSGTITGRTISGGTITGTSINGGTIEGARIISRSNGTSVQVYDSKFFVFGTQGTARLRIQANGDESGEIDFWTTDGFWAGKIRGYRDGDFGRIQIDPGNNGFLGVDRIQTSEIACNGSGMYANNYWYITPSGSNERLAWMQSGNRVLACDMMNVDGSTRRLGWVYDDHISRYVLAGVGI